MFPYICGICYTMDSPSSPCFTSLRCFLAHWRGKHPEIEYASEIVHPEFGNHYTTLPHLRLSFYTFPPTYSSNIQYQNEEEIE